MALANLFRGRSVGELPIYVPFGPLADITAAKADVRYTPETGHLQCTIRAPAYCRTDRLLTLVAFAATNEPIKPRQTFLRTVILKPLEIIEVLFGGARAYAQALAKKTSHDTYRT